MVNNNNLNSVYASLSDQTRRDILLKISAGNLNLSQVAKAQNISLPAISKHLKVLEKAKLIERQKVGREFNFTLTEIAKYWVKQFQNLENFLKRG